MLWRTHKSFILIILLMWLWWRMFSETRHLGTEIKQGGAGIFWQCLTVYWPVLQGAQMWMTVASVREVYPDASWITSLCLNEAKMGQNLPCLDSELVSAPHWVDRRTALNICPKCVWVCACMQPQVWIGVSQWVHMTRHSSDGLKWISQTKKRHTLVPSRNQPRLEPFSLSNTHTYTRRNTHTCYTFHKTV